MPATVFARINEPKKKATFAKNGVPLVRGYFLSRVIQYNSTMKHFRMVKLAGRSGITIMDRGERIHHNDQQIRKNILFGNEEWSNYVIMLTRGNKEQVRKCSTDSVRCTLGGVKRLMVGGSDGQDHDIKILSWNVCSWNNPVRRQAVLNEKPVVAALLESRAKIEGERNYNVLNARPAPRADGGEKVNAALLMRKGVVTVEREWSDMDLVAAVMTGGILGMPLLTIAAYFCPRRRQTEAQLFSRIQQIIDICENQWPGISVVVCCDLNCTVSELQQKEDEGARTLTQMHFAELGATCRGRECGSEGRQIDFIFSNFSPKKADKVLNPGQGSDHALLRITLRAQVQKNEYLKPNRKAVKELIQQLNHGFSVRQSYQRLTQPLKTIRVTEDKIFSENRQDTRDIVKQGWMERHQANYRSEAKSLLRERRKKGHARMANRKLKNMLRYHELEPQNQGLIVRGQDDEGNMLIGSELESALLREYMKVVEGTRIDYSPDGSRGLEFPELNLSDEQLIALCKMKLGKVPAWDCFPDSIFDLRDKSMTHQRRLEILHDITTRQYWNEEAVTRHFRSRLICLNKVAPRIPKTTQFRPIVVTSVLVKFLEGIILGALEKYVNCQITWNQMGFRRRCGIDLCKAEVLSQAEKMRAEFRAGGKHDRKSRPRAVFFDVKGAYDHVDRSKLYQLLREKGVLNGAQMQLLRFLLQNVYLDHGSEMMRGRRGVPQGLRSSPLLFNIYIEGLAQELQRRQIFSKFFADDMVVLTKGEVEARTAITVS